MSSKISVVINTFNEQIHLERAIKSVAWADEIIVCDMHSQDKSVDTAKELGAKVFFHPRVDYVEPARNFAISKTKNEWILILDPDEEVSNALSERLIDIASGNEHIDYVRIPRKNIIFGYWMKASMWWPDYQIRFFKKGKVKWTNKIHRPPQVIGEGLDIPQDEKLSITHYNYQNIGQFIERMNRYTTVEAAQLKEEEYQFRWQDFIEKPLNEFLSRFFALRGFSDGIYGLALSLLQSFSVLLVYLKLWELNKFPESQLNLSEIEKEKKKAGFAIDYWFKQTKFSKNPFKSFLQKFK